MCSGCRCVVGVLEVNVSPVGSSLGPKILIWRMCESLPFSWFAKTAICTMNARRHAAIIRSSVLANTAICIINSSRHAATMCEWMCEWMGLDITAAHTNRHTSMRLHMLPPSHPPEKRSHMQRQQDQEVSISRPIHRGQQDQEVSKTTSLLASVAATCIYACSQKGKQFEALASCQTSHESQKQVHATLSAH
jgi:hypothetical protein